MSDEQIKKLPTALQPYAATHPQHERVITAKYLPKASHTYRVIPTGHVVLKKGAPRTDPIKSMVRQGLIKSPQPSKVKTGSTAWAKLAMMGNTPFTQKMMGGTGLPGYKKGGPVKKDGYLTDKEGRAYARVHRGEKVVPKGKKGLSQG